MMTKEEQEIFGGQYPQASKDHHQDKYEYDEQFFEAEHYAQQLELQEQEYDKEK